MNLASFPRYAGTPAQVVVKDAEQFEAFLAFNRGKNPVYCSHNSMNAQWVNVECVPTDLDASKEAKGKIKWTLEDTMEDAVRFREACERHGVAYKINFTGGGAGGIGGGGFHAFLLFRGLQVKNNTAYKVHLRAFQEWIIREAKLKTFDPKVASGDIRRILRVPNCPYMDKNGKASGLYTVEVPPTMLVRGGLASIMEYAKEPRPVSLHTASETFVEAFARLKIETKSTREAALSTATTEYVGITDSMVKALLPRMCIHSGIMRPDAPHIVRFEACLTMVNAGFDVDFLIKFFRDISDKAQWYNADDNERSYHVTTIWQKGRGAYKTHSCDRLRSEGLCCGAVCPIFKEAFPNG